jgi:site-specific recombinase XerD
MQIWQAREQYVRWLVVTRDLSPHTIRAYDGDLAALERHLGSRLVVAQIDRDRLLAFVETQRSAGLATASIRRRVSGVRGFFRWLVSRQLLASDPWAGASVAASRTRTLPRVLPTHELDRLLSSLRRSAGVDHMAGTEMLERPDDSTTLLAVALMVATGLRVGEVVSIKCTDVDVSGRTIRIIGKGRRERLVFLTNDWLKGLTHAHLRTRRRLGVAHAYLLFNCQRAPLSAAALRSRLVKAANVAGCDTHVTPHVLRHTAATQLIEAGVDIRYIQRLLGHASLSTTEIYTHVSDVALRRVVSTADVLGQRMR